ncbi:hypothetical protein GCM10022226_61930 [Sphaerisporangium flaviroseum]|uniref:PD-(D/E)XK endonuclease-like domain-containing protein n=1 Tax=Sphaerisporangium flaviroseum TaxID=509199 RepID=A0ABP7J2T2_9ACTN
MTSLALAADPFAALVADLDQVIGHVAAHQPRSLQRRLGPSEIGCPCHRRIGYKLAGVPPCHHSMKWEAYIGTAFHAQIAKDLEAILAPDGWPRFLVEQKVHVGQIAGEDIDGTSDVYDRVSGYVIDWKLVGKTSLARYRARGPGAQYQVQVHTYGRGWRLRGFPVNGVAIAFLPRSERFERRHFWGEPYDEHIAVQALAQVDAIDAAIKAAGVQALPLLSTANAGCHHCDWFRPGSRDVTRGCPGELALPHPTQSLIELIAPKEGPWPCPPSPTPTTS